MNFNTNVPRTERDEQGWIERYDRQQRLMYPERYLHAFVVQGGCLCGRCGRSVTDPIHVKDAA